MNSTLEKLYIPLSIVIAGIIIASGVFFSFLKTSGNSPANQIAQTNTRTTQNVDIKNVKIKGEPFIGDKNAPVTVAYWSDYQCPFCKKFDEETLPEVIQNYVNTGKIKVVFKDLAFLGPDSETAAITARAVWEVAPQKFEEWHKTVYNNQDNENSGWGSQDDLLALTKTVLGSNDEEKVAELIQTKKSEYQKVIDADKIEASSFGIQRTPTFIIGKHLLSGAQPYAVVKQLIDTQL